MVIMYARCTNKNNLTIDYLLFDFQSLIRVRQFNSRLTVIPSKNITIILITLYTFTVQGDFFFFKVRISK